MIEMSETVEEIFKALAKFQGAVSDPKRSANNTHFRSKYATLEEVLVTVRPVMSANGLSLVQFPGPVENGKVTITSQLSHASGEWLRSTMQMPVEKGTAQGVGSALTYSRRYAAQAILGVASEDDDGEAAVGRDKPQPAQQQGGTSAPFPQAQAAKQAARKMVSKAISEEQFSSLGEMPGGRPAKVGVGVHAELTVDQLPSDYIARDSIMETFRKKMEAGDVPQDTYAQLVWQHNAAKMELAQQAASNNGQ